MAKYYPYLRGKQFELMSLRAFAAESPGNQKICPIIELVRTSHSSMTLAIQAMLEHKLPFAFILNPQEGDFKRPENKQNLLDEIPELADARGSWIPAYLYCKGNSGEILAHAKENGLVGIMIVAQEDLTNEREIIALCGDTIVSYIIISEAVTPRKVAKNFERLRRISSG